MVVSVFTYAVGYNKTGYILIAMTAASALIEYVWIQMVYHRFPVLRADEMERRRRSRAKVLSQQAMDVEERPFLGSTSGPKGGKVRRFGHVLFEELRAWREFAALPIFWSECGRQGPEIHLSFDGSNGTISRHAEDG